MVVPISTVLSTFLKGSHLVHSCCHFWLKASSGVPGVYLNSFYSGAGVDLRGYLNDFLRISRPGALFWLSEHHPGHFFHRGDQQEGPKVLVSRVLGTRLEVIFCTFGHIMRTLAVVLHFLQRSVQGSRFLLALGRPGDPRTL